MLTAGEDPTDSMLWRKRKRELVRMLLGSLRAWGA